MTSKAEKLVKEFMDLFMCRRDAYAVGYKKPDGKYGYPPARDPEGKDLPLTEEVVYKHFKGEHIVGVWPLYDINKCSWVALDFDASATGEDPLELAYQQKAKFLEDGIITFVERSRSGTGAHLWLFLDGPMRADVARRVVIARLIDSEDAYDRPFPNQDSAENGYGNLIALPYHGLSYKNNQSGFLDDERRLMGLESFLRHVKRNKVSYLSKFDEGPSTSLRTREKAIVGSRSRAKTLSGGMKVLKFCKWMQAAQERMHLQNQEPEFYALCCQFAQLEDGERLAFKVGKLHPYSDERIKRKFQQAKEKALPHTCYTLREEFGYECTCDIDYGVNHCYEIAELSFEHLLASRRGKVYNLEDIYNTVVDTAKQLYKRDGKFGYPYGYDRLDDLTELRDNDLIVLGARTSVGKTSIAVDISFNLTTRGIPVYWASMEMSREQLVTKFLSRLCEVDSRDIMRGTLDFRDWSRVLKSRRLLDSIPLFVDDQTKDINRMIDVMAEQVDIHGKGLIVVDYIEMLRKAKGESMFSLTSRASLELKGMAKLLGVPVLALSNFNRKAEQDLLEDENPQDSWLRNSGLLEQSADVILYLLGKRGKGTVKRELHIQKERFTGMANEKVFLWFEQSYCKFSTFNPKRAKQDIIIKKNLNLDSNLDLI